MKTYTQEELDREKAKAVAELKAQGAEREKRLRGMVDKWRGMARDSTLFGFYMDRADELEAALSADAPGGGK